MSLDVDRLGRGERIQAAGALVLFVALFFLPWWGITTTTPAGSVSSSLNGWDMFTNSCWVWLATVLAVAAHLAWRAAGRSVELPVAAEGLLAVLAALSALLIVYRILDHPRGGTGQLLGFGYSAVAGIRIGIWVALGGALAIVYGCQRALVERGLSVHDVREQLAAAFAPPGRAPGDERQQGGEREPPERR